MKKIIVPIHMVFLTGFAYGQSNTENYIQSRTYLDSTKISDPDKKQLHSVQYFDGFGRSKQVINVKATPGGGDVVIPFVYDSFGRQTREYLPVPQSSSTGGLIYGQASGLVPLPVADVLNVYNGDKAYSEKQLEVSPLDRILQHTQVGDAWSTKPVVYHYDTSSSADHVRRFTTVTDWTDNASISVIRWDSADFGLNQLYKTTITDEDGNPSIEFKNGRGQTVLIRKVLGVSNYADTYYVYNEFNQLALVIPPKAVVEFFAGNPVNNAVLSDEILNNLCYQYHYDGRNRLVEKKLPGKGWEFMVYDKQDRLVLTQDAVLRTTANNFGSRGWLFTKYDQFGRVVYTGFFQNTGTRSAMQTAINNMSSNASNNEIRSRIPITSNSMDVYYTKDAFPTGSMSILMVNYYDTYPSSVPISIPTTTLGQSVLPEPYQTLSRKNTNGLLLSTYVKNIEDNQWTKSYNWYDMKGRVVGTYSLNHLGGYTTTETGYDFSGAVKTSIIHHKRLPTDTERLITENFSYDSQNRLLTHTHQVDSNPVEILAQNEYNALSQLKTKKVGGATVSSPLQTVDYQYNIRGWMTKINDPSNLGNDLFGYKINYNQVEGLENPNTDFMDLKVKPKYNGNIAEVSWRTLTEENEPLKRYGYVYDHLNRLSAGFYQREGAEAAREYFEMLEYDLNGNITKLQRSENLISGNTALVIDKLKYDYTGNRLTKVTEEQIGNSSGYPYLTTPNTIGYDDNGNMISHPDKGINSIAYNFLNLPNNISVRPGTKGANTTRSIYRADGVKLSKVFNTNAGNSITTTDYLDGFQYKFDSGGLGSMNPQGLQFVPTSEGYYDFTNNSYIYNYTDHLGNVRLSYTDTSKDGIIQPRQYKIQQCDGPNNPPFEIPNCIDYYKPGEIVEVNNYYPFGMLHNYTLTTQNAYQYKYNGKELQETGFYSFKWRNYMPDLGRFFNIDPLSEKYTYQSHYNFSENKVVSHIELEGLEAIDANKIRKVFDNGKQGKTYRITIHVDQPGKGGDRDTYEINKGTDPGHSFITLSRENTDGTTDVKTFGFYPYPPSVNPLASEADGKVKDNYGHEKEVVQSWLINENKFNNVLDFVESKKNTKYDLNTNNCTDFVINAAGSAGINLPKTKGTWPNGGGSNPGDLGQDMRDQNARMRKGLPPNPAPTTPNNKKEDNDKKISL
ncbi:DUF6443 domain-containing protein [Chryseobacterium sp. JUb7]|uniref:DUF6443 domain-containing protein n=1 Tax=Chryseobacterium sp. JUb7 TaxID=2940599 RepID=UPI002169670B|nr:DUF6443 domain-containing protein [Chryseobacterium sp. JUb7]MCS3533062.1 RHS repeat-associated protein [Chryseobacterium sp. JUb7]